MKLAMNKTLQGGNLKKAVDAFLAMIQSDMLSVKPLYPASLVAFWKQELFERRCIIQNRGYTGTNCR